MRRSASASTVPFLLLTVLAAGCGRPHLDLPDLPPEQPVAESPADEVESVVFLLGDAGKTREQYGPVVLSLRAEVEHWAGRLGRDSAVTVLYLGDNIYPVGLRPPPAPEWPADSAQLEELASILAGPNARARRAFGLFMAGNHDWGDDPGRDGEQRLRNQQEFLDRRRAQGTLVELVPDAGRPGPTVVDMGSNLRMLLLDTAWWLLQKSAEPKSEMVRGVEQAMEEADGRLVLIAGHHPLKSASSHGGLVPFWETVGVRYLLARSGAMLQDLNSIPYRELRRGLTAIWARTGPPLIFAAGHDHNLQVIQGVGDTEPVYILVSGSGSKVSAVGHASGMLYRRSDPGYMRLVFRKDGTVDLFVTAANGDLVKCDDPDSLVRSQCVAATWREFRTVYSRRLR